MSQKTSKGKNLEGFCSSAAWSHVPAACAAPVGFLGGHRLRCLSSDACLPSLFGNAQCHGVKSHPSLPVSGVQQVATGTSQLRGGQYLCDVLVVSDVGGPCPPAETYLLDQVRGFAVHTGTVGSKSSPGWGCLRLQCSMALRRCVSEGESMRGAPLFSN